MRNRRFNAALVVIVLLSTIACLHKSGGAHATPWEKVHTYNAAFAETNNAVEKGAEAAVNAGLWPAVQAAPLIGWSGQVAALHLQVTAILGKGSVTDADLASVRSLLAQIKESGIALINSGAIAIKNPKSQQTFAADVNSIYAAGDVILEALQQIKAGGN